VQYADFAVWQREWFQPNILEEQMSYWRRQLASAPVLDLPTDRPRPPVQGYRGAGESFELDQELSRQIKQLARRQGVTLFMLMLAAFKTLLYRYSGQDDVCVGVPMAGRDSSQTKPLVGFFINTLILRTSLSENPTFQELLKRVRETCLEAYDHPDIPFETLVAELQPERDLSRSPLFQVWFVLQPPATSKRSLSNISLSRVPTQLETAQFDLALLISEEDQIAGTMIYDADLFDRQRIVEFLKRYAALLAEVANDSAKGILEIQLDPEEKSFSPLAGGDPQIATMQEADFAF